jgi:predicted nucleic acid-binding protein
MKCYADTSFLFSYYASDANSARADAWRQAKPVALPLTPLNRLELRNALELAVFQKRLSAQAVRETWAIIESDLQSGLLTRTAFSGALFDEAELLAISHTAHVGLRSLDLLHIAAAKLLEAEEFVTFDQRQAALAARVGLRIFVL